MHRHLGPFAVAASPWREVDRQELSNIWLVDGNLVVTKLQSQKKVSVHQPNVTFVYSVGYVTDASHQLDKAPNEYKHLNL